MYCEMCHIDLGHLPGCPYDDDEPESKYDEPIIETCGHCHNLFEYNKEHEGYCDECWELLDVPQDNK